MRCISEFSFPQILLTTLFSKTFQAEQPMSVERMFENESY